MTTEERDKFTLKEARSLFGMSKRDLSKASGIAFATIHGIEKGKGPYRTNLGVAFALADALALGIDEIEWPRGLSHLGRPAKTGKPIEVTRTLTLTFSITEKLTVTPALALCQLHNLTLATGTGLCDSCID